MTRPALAIVGLLAVASSASAEEPGYLSWSSRAYLAAAAADHATTAYCLAAPQCHEHNPMYAWMQPAGAPVLLGAASAVDLAGAWAWKRVVGPRHPKLAAAGFIGFAVVRAVQAVANARNGQAARGHSEMVRALPPPMAVATVTWD